MWDTSVRKQAIASLPEMMTALSARASRRTAFRKLKDLAARTSYSHRGGYCSLNDELADFDERDICGRLPGSASPASAP